MRCHHQGRKRAQLACAEGTARPDVLRLPSKRCPDRRADRTCTVVLEVQVPSRSLDHSASWVSVLSRCAQSSTMILHIQYASHQHIFSRPRSQCFTPRMVALDEPKALESFQIAGLCVPKEKLLWSWWFASPTCTISSHHITQLTTFTEYTYDRMPNHGGKLEQPKMRHSAVVGCVWLFFRRHLGHRL